MDSGIVHRVFAGSLLAALFVTAALADANTEPAPSVQVQTTPATERTLETSISAYGRVQADPNHTVSVNLPWAGLVSRLWVRPGQRIGAGEPLLELQAAPGTRADYAQAEAAVEFARRDLQRVKDLLKQQLATREQLATAEHALQDAQAKLQAQRSVSNQSPVHVVRAPIDGVVTQVSVTQGQQVQADTAALQLADLQSLVVLLGLELEEIARVRPGAPTVLTSVFPPEVKIASALSEVHAMVNPDTRLVDALVPIPRHAASQVALEEPMRGVISVERQRVLAVPRSAVLTDARGSYLFVVRAGRARRIDVRTGIEEQDWVAVSGPLKPGDPVVSVGNYELSDGMAVREARR